jgi:hypothetical protein
MPGLEGRPPPPGAATRPATSRALATHRADRCHPSLGLAALTLALGSTLLFTSSAHAGLLDPGPLTKAHQNLEGIKNCTKCHGAASGEKVSAAACLDCHKELEPRISKGLGFHGKLKDEEKSKCETCHLEHQGRDFAIVDWGDKGKKGFDHARTGFVLNGKHAKADCAKCHESRLIKDEVMKKWLADPQHKGRETFIGVGVVCASCHFDEHRGQLAPQECKACHEETDWKKVTKFNHDRSNYPLTGAHAKVECLKCHARELGEAPAPALFPKPVNEVFSRFKPVAHDSCLNCHKDPHESRFGTRCTDCHVTASWKEIHQAGSTGGRADRKFHETTRYPLRGAHENVSCDACHGTGKRKIFKNMQFANCIDCHADAHQGQLGKYGSKETDCTRCHTLDGFTTPKFEVEQHAKTTYPLEGAHAAVSCLGCHIRDPQRVKALKLGGSEKPGLTAVKLSPAVFLLRVDTQKCDTCHKDVHGGQFAKLVAGPAAFAAALPTCESCHVAESFHTLKFDHAKTKFPLEGKHAQATCAQCHAAPAPGAPVAYRGVTRACNGCHLDIHVGQFTDAAGAPADCARCHSVEEFKKVRFVHAPPEARFALDGKHAELECKACHGLYQVTPKLQSVRYKPLPITCEGCHVDEHDGAFKRFAK